MSNENSAVLEAPVATSAQAAGSNGTAKPAAKKGRPAPAKAEKNGKAASKTKPAPAKRPAAKAEPAAKQWGIERSNDLPWNEKKVAVFKALRKLGAVGAGAARPASEVSAKAGNGITARDVRHYCYHAAAAGLTGVAEVEGLAGYGFYLTKKGQAMDPDAELKKRAK